MFGQILKMTNLSCMNAAINYLQQKQTHTTPVKAYARSLVQTIVPLRATTMMM